MSAVAASTDVIEPNLTTVTPIAAGSLRAAAAHFPTGVAVVTSTHPETGQPIGCTISSFLSVSLDPPTVAVSLMKSGSTADALIKFGRFGINVLASHQHGVAHIFASSGISHTDRFRSSFWRFGATGVPVFDTGLSTMECEIDNVVSAGDHYLILGLVVDLFVHGSGAPLVHHQGAMTSLRR